MVERLAGNGWIVWRQFFLAWPMQEFALLPRMFSRREGTARNVFARRHGNGDLKQLERIEIIMSFAVRCGIAADRVKIHDGVFHSCAC